MTPALSSRAIDTLRKDSDSRLSCLRQPGTTEDHDWNSFAFMSAAIMV